MLVRTQIELERAELEVVLASDSFAKSPNLARLLQLIVEKHLAGQEMLIKEYTLAVEALGRSSEFNPKKNSIVRVEVRRLRKKLKAYYDSEGADHAVIISIEVGHYFPSFEWRTEIPTHPASRSASEINSIKHSVVPFCPQYKRASLR
jgi:hypothetical protein